MTCEQLAEFLGDYCAGELPEPRRAAFERHLDECPDCVRYLASYRHTVAASRIAYQDFAEVVGPPPEQLIQAILLARCDT